jgi:hypothetical protein
MENTKKIYVGELGESPLEESSLSELEPESEDLESVSLGKEDEEQEGMELQQVQPEEEQEPEGTELQEVQPEEEQETEGTELQEVQPEEEQLAEEPENNPNQELDKDKLNMFYYLKNKYELDKNERCNKFALAKENISWKMKRAYFAARKPKCINCKRKVGSIFTIKNEDNFRKFLGKCGDTEAPCEFHIEFKVPKTIRIDKECNNIFKKLNELQEAVVVTKNKVLFGMLDPATAVTQFDELKNDITSFTNELEKYSTKLLGVTHNLEKKKEINAKIIEFNENVDELNMIFQKYMLEDEPLKTAVNYFIDTLYPSAKYLSELKYADREVEIVKDLQGNLVECKYHTFDYLLSDFELTNPIEVVEYNLGESNVAPPEVILPEPEPREEKKKQPTTNKTRKVRQVKAKNKTVRNLDNQDDLNAVMKKILQKIIMEDRLNITRREIYEMIEDQYHVTDVRGKYGNVIKEYFQKNVALWVQVYPEIMDLAYVMAQNKTIQDNTVSGFIGELNKTHPDIDFSPFKKVIEAILIRYVKMLNNVSSSGDNVPRPDWPSPPS